MTGVGTRATFGECGNRDGAFDARTKSTDYRRCGNHQTGLEIIGDSFGRAAKHLALVSE